MASPFARLPANPEKTARQRMQHWHNQDGLPEIVLGIFCLVFSALIFLPTRFPHRSNAYKTLILAKSLAPLLGIPLMRLPLHLRKRYLLGKTGYCQPRPIKPGSFLRAAAVAAVVAVAVAAGLPASQWFLAVTGVLAGAFLGWIGWFGRTPRLIAGGALCAVASIVLALRGLPLDLEFAIFFGFAGLLALVSGAVALTRFLRVSAEPGE